MATWLVVVEMHSSPLVGIEIQHDPEPRAPPADPPAHFGSVLADASCEYQNV